MMQPGWALLFVGIGSFFASRFIDVVPLIGGMLGVMLFTFSIFAVIGGVWLVVANARSSDA